MLGSMVVTLREGLEGALVVGILLAYLTRIGEGRRSSAIWLGVGLALIASILVGGIMFLTVGELEASTEQLFEGGMLLVAVGILSYMIFWLHRQATDLKGNLQRQVAVAAASRSNLSLAFLAFVVVVREGLETALFLFGTTRGTSPVFALAGGFVGLVVAVVLGYAIFRGGLRLNLSAFFRSTGVLLIFFAAGMFANGLHELIEANIFPAIVDPLYSLSAILPAESVLGGFLKALFGYNSAPSFSEATLYILYLVSMLRFFLGNAERPVTRHRLPAVPTL
jgi:high-affinity iron transporter